MKKVLKFLKNITIVTLICLGSPAYAIQTTTETIDFCAYGYDGFPNNKGKATYNNAHNYCESVVRIDKRASEIGGDNVYERCMCSFSPFGGEDLDSCPSMTVEWGAACSGVISDGASYEVNLVSHERTNDRFQGSASFICFDGVWQVQQSQCTQMPQKCEGGQIATWPVTSPEWAASGGGSNAIRFEPKADCRALMPEAVSGMITGANDSSYPITVMDGTVPELVDENWQDRYDQTRSQAKMRCFDGQWTPIEGAYECVYVPKGCPAIEYTTEKGCSFDLEQTDHGSLFVSSDPNTPFNSKGEVRAFCWDGNWEIRSESCRLSCDNTFDPHVWDAMPAIADQCEHGGKSNTEFSETRTAPDQIFTLNNENPDMDGLRRLRCNDGVWDAESEICAPKDCTSGVVSSSWNVNGNVCQHDTYDRVISAGSRVQLPNTNNGFIGSKVFYCDNGTIVEESSNHTCANIGEKLCYVDQGAFVEPYFVVPAWSERSMEARCRYLEEEGYTHCLTNEVMNSGNFCTSPMGNIGSEYSNLTSNSCQMRVADLSATDPNGIQHVQTTIGRELVTYQCDGVSWQQVDNTCVYGYTDSTSYSTNPKPSNPTIDESIVCPAQNDYTISWASSDADIYNFAFDLPESRNMDIVQIFDEIPAVAGVNKSCDTSYISVGQAQCVGDEWEFRLTQHCRGNILQPEDWTVQLGCQISEEGASPLSLEYANTGTCNRNLQTGTIEDEDRKELAIIYPLIDDQPFNRWAQTKCSSATCQWDYEVLEYTSECRICAKNGHINDTNGDCLVESVYNDKIYVGLKSSDEIYEQYCDARFKITFTDGNKEESLTVRGISYSEKPCVSGDCGGGDSGLPQCGYENGRTVSSLDPSSNELCYVGNTESFDEFLDINKYNWDCSNVEGTVSCSAFKTGACGAVNGTSANNLTSGSAGLCSIGSVSTFSATDESFTWYCSNGASISEQCSAVKSSSCGIANGGVYSTSPYGSDLCTTGTPSTVSQIGSLYDWSCNNQGDVVNCSAFKSPSCGSALNGTFDNLTGGSTTLCGIGSASGFSITGDKYLWVCQNGGANISCSANVVPSCGSAEALNHSTTPSTNLCNNGSSSSVASNALTYSWSCANGSQTVSCEATKTAQCGSDDNSNPLSLDETSTSLCNIGNAVDFDDSGENYNWSCTNNSSTVNCSAYKEAVCGADNLGTFDVLDMSSSALCSIGNPINFTDTSSLTFNWECSSGLSSVSCEAYKDSGCGTANNGTYPILNAMDPNLCEIGSVNNFQNLQSTYEWNCDNGAASLSCRASKSPVCGSKNGAAVSSLTETSSGVCLVGNVSNFDNSDSDIYSWSCNNGSETTSCSAYKENDCGVRANSTFDNLSESSTGLCSNGSVSNFVKTGTTYEWTCENGPAVKSCTAYQNAQCGTGIGSCDIGDFKLYTSTIMADTSRWMCENAGGFLSSECSAEKAPALDDGQCGINKDECVSGTFADDVDTTTLFKWSCGSNLSATNEELGSKRVYCSANKGSCGASNGVVVSGLSSSSSSLCAVGVSNGFSFVSGRYAWNCETGGVNSPCEAYQESSCGTTAGQTYSNLTSGNSFLCGFGEVNNFNLSGTTYSWTCNGYNDISVSSCSAYKESSCGAANGGNYENLQNYDASLCSSGTIVNFSENSTNYTWGCRNNNNETASCSANRDIIATCGVKDGTVTDPINGSENGLCSTGAVQNVTSTSSRYNWDCVTATETASCFSYVRPECGFVSGGTFASLSSSSGNLCSVGDSIDFIESTSSYLWKCKNDTVSVSCSASKFASCGSADGGTFGNTPVAGLCSSGSSSGAVLNGNNYEWTCTSGASSESCQAFRGASCGTDHQSTNEILLGTSSNLCSYGNSQGFTATDQRFEWSCVSGSSNKSCFSYKGATCGGADSGYFGTLNSLSDNLCGVGTLASFNASSDSYMWTCLSGESLASCSAYKRASCGNSNGVTSTTLDINDENLCNNGAPQNFIENTNTYNWECNLSGDITNCGANKASGCGNAAYNHHDSLTQLSSNLCATGDVVNFVFSETTYNWECDNAGDVRYCLAYQNAYCDNTVFGGCSVGEMSRYVGNKNDDFAKWYCKNDGLKESLLCTKEKNPPIASGVCGDQKDTCDSGVFGDVPDASGSYDWTCGSNISGDFMTKQSFRANCSVESAGCGSANNSTHNNLTSMSYGLCSGTSTVSGFVKSGTTYTWSCELNGGTESCSAYQTATCDNSQFGGCSEGSFNSYTSDVNDDFSTWNCINDNAELSAQCTKEKDKPIDSGDCGLLVNQCNEGTYNDVPDDGLDFKWTCGTNIDGTDTVKQSVIQNCSTVQPKCGSLENTTNSSLSLTDSNLCAAGSTASDLVLNDTTYNWNCNRSGGAVSCEAYKTATCDNTKFGGCSSGDFVTYVSDNNDLNAVWNCENAVGIMSVNCTKEKNDPIDTGVCGVEKDVCLSGTFVDTSDTSNDYVWMCGNNLNGDFDTKPSVQVSCNSSKPSCGVRNGNTYSSLSATSSNLCDTSSTVSGFNKSGLVYTWSCDRDGGSLSCEAYQYATCGSNNGQTYGSLTSSSANLCATGVSSGFTDSGSVYNWNCDNTVGASTSCSAYKDASCGVASDQTHNNLTLASSGLCSIGNASSMNLSGTTYTWSCTNGSDVQSCTAYKTAACDNSQFGGCSEGSFVEYTSALSDITSTWTCSSDSGNTVSCSRAKNAPVDTGVCGANVDECVSGTLGSLSDVSGMYRWSCGTNIEGTNTVEPSHSVSCDAQSPSCGSVQGGSYGSLSSSNPNLCASGSTVSGFTVGVETYDWSCNRSGGSVSCLAYKDASCDNTTFGGCGSNSQFVEYTSPLSSTTSTWTCENNSATDTVSCSKAKTQSPDYGVCGENYFSCDSGAPSSLQLSDPTKIEWNCGFNSAGTNTVAPGNQVVCEIDRPICGYVNGGTYPSEASNSNKCSVGTVINSSSDGVEVTWDCENDGYQTSCQHYLSIGCGSASGGTFSNAPSTNLCVREVSISTITEDTNTYSWTCIGEGSGNTANCSAYKEAICSTSSYYSCDIGSVSSTNTTDDTTAYWTCSNGSSNENCQRVKGSALENGRCNTSTVGNALFPKYYDTPPASSSLCYNGTPTSITQTSSTYEWTCQGSEATPIRSAGADQNCIANRVVAPTCGTSPGQCNDSTNIGYTSSISSSISEWRCRNQAGTMVNCSAPKLPPLDMGSCGTTPNDCISGTSRDITDTSSQALWTCGTHISTSHTNIGSIKYSCSAERAACGSNQGGSYSSLSASDTSLCAVGSVSGFSKTGTTYTWNCTNSFSTESCSAYQRASCDTSSFGGCARGTFGSYTSSCSSTYDDSPSTSWTCLNDNNVAESCSKVKNSNNAGTCGGAINQCNRGSLNDMDDNASRYRWGCGSNTTCSNSQQGGQAAFCSLLKPGCGYINGTSRSSEAPDNIKCANTANTISNKQINGTTISWDCNRSGGTISCEHYINPSCGSANGQIVASAPSGSSLCQVGSAIDFVDLGNSYRWRCENDNGVLKTCSATKQATCDTSSYWSCGVGNDSNRNCSTTNAGWDCVNSTNTSSRCVKPLLAASYNGTCGTANGGLSPSAPSNNLCASGTLSVEPYNDGGVWKWTCSGSAATCDGSNQNTNTPRRAGTSENCTATVGQPPVCSTTTFRSCDVGLRSGYTSPDNSDVATWNCTSSGLTVSCSKDKNQVNGSCGSYSRWTGQATCGWGFMGDANQEVTGFYSWGNGANATWTCNGIYTDTTKPGVPVNCRYQGGAVTIEP